MGRSPTFSRGIAGRTRAYRVVFCYKIYAAAEPTSHWPFYHVSKLKQGKIMRLHLISGAVLVWTALALAAICLAELGAVPQNVPF
jgi:hypothetical protein